ncbi:hypothetical protein E2C01_051734 [Portunus trituberculatus]|uniref:Uncharacterized protein n=1 Tax=Portunus trituberculatus TaxID=210409 RepID=A0A5B7GKD1_PORTR|nr:hypothetical protein [Portunus trituberculatus]
MNDRVGRTPNTTAGEEWSLRSRHDDQKKREHTENRILAFSSSSSCLRSPETRLLPRDLPHPSYTQENKHGLCTFSLACTHYPGPAPLSTQTLVYPGTSPAHPHASPLGTPRRLTLRRRPQSEAGDVLTTTQCLHNPRPVLHQGGPAASGPWAAVCLFTRRNYAARLQDMVFSNSAYNHGNLLRTSRLNSLDWLLCTRRNTLQHVGNIVDGVKYTRYIPKFT